ncbi:MAG: GyrI-like domain-containing protein [Acidimicrobiales bacterium]|jgi:predicted transcriptional regulator YdeE
MTPKIVELTLSPRRLVGVSCEFVGSMDPNSDAGEVIPPTWGVLDELAHSNHLDHSWSLAVMTPSATSGKMTYTACVPAGDATGTPDGMAEILFGGGTFVGCEHVGQIDTIGATTAWFYSEYLPGSSYRLIEGPHLEIYDQRFELGSPSSIVTICAPISG